MVAVIVIVIVLGGYRCRGLGRNALRTGHRILSSNGGRKCTGHRNGNSQLDSTSLVTAIRVEHVQILAIVIVTVIPVASVIVFIFVVVTITVIVMVMLAVFVVVITHFLVIAIVPVIGISRAIVL